MFKYILIAVGGALGTLARYWISGVSYAFFKGEFPWGTLIVNLIGAFIIGLLWGFFENISLSANIKVFLFIGLLGAFTTFSTLCLENFHLFRDGELWIAFVNILASNIGGIALVYFGYYLSKIILLNFK